MSSGSSIEPAEPDRRYGIGSFAAQQRLVVPIGLRADLLFAQGAGAFTYTLDLRNGDSLAGIAPTPGQTCAFDGRTVRDILVSALTGTILWALVDLTAPATWGESTVLPPTAAIDGQQFSPVNVAAATGETTAQGGANSVPAGALTRFRLSVGGPLTTAGSLAYVAVKGHTSGRYYAVCFAGSVGMTNEIRAVNTSELLDLVYRNADTIAHPVHGSWEAFKNE